MPRLKRVLAWLLLAHIALALGGAAAEELVRIKPTYSPEPNATPPRMRIVLTFQTQHDGKWKAAEEIVDPDLGGPLDSASYQLLDATGNPWKLTPRAERAATNYNAIFLDLERPLTPQQKYTLKILPGVLVFHVGAQQVTNAETVLTLDAGEWKRNIEYLERRSLRQNKVEFLGGTPGGVSSLELTLDKSQFLGVQWLNLALQAQADFTLSTRDRSNYFNSVSAGINFYRPLTNWNRYSEVSVHGEVESDQKFQLVDGVLGVQFAFFPKDKISAWLSRIFVKDNVDVGPLVILGYDYVHNLKGDADEIEKATRINTEEADHRAKGVLRWRLPVARGLQVQNLSALSGAYDIGFDFELKGIYDFPAEKFLDQSRISLVFTRTSSERFKPALSLTWARGKAPPTFEEISALLAGLRVTF